MYAHHTSGHDAISTAVVVAIVHCACLQVRRLLSSAEPTTVRIANAPEVGDPEMQALQQARLLALGMRTMTLPLGRGALTLGSCLPPPPHPPPDLPHPQACTSAVSPPCAQ